MVVLPELKILSQSKTCGPASGRGKLLPGTGPAKQYLIIPGSIFERDGEHIYNTSPVINPAGEVGPSP
jgi:predicted amidohydrolase